MIDFIAKPIISRDFQSSVLSVDYLLHIKATEQDIYIASKKQSFKSPDGYLAFWEDADLVISGLIEKIDLRSKQIYTPNISLNLNNYKIAWEKEGIHKRSLSDILGSGYGTIIDVYMKTQTCESIDDCVKITALKILRINHDDSKISIKAEDASQQGFYVNIPRDDNILSEDNTFEPYVGKAIPILYGHLEDAPSIIYTEGSPDANNNIYDENLIILLPDNAYLNSDKNIFGIKSFGRDGLWDGMNHPGFMDRKYLELRNNNIVQVDIGGNLCSILYYPYWNSSGEIHRHFRDGNFSTHSQYESNGDHVRLTTRHGLEYTLLKNHALWTHSYSKMIGNKGYGLTSMAGEIENTFASCYYLIHEASFNSNGYMNFGSVNNYQNSLYTRYLAVHAASDPLNDLIPVNIDSFEHRIALETISFESISGFDRYSIIKPNGLEEHHPTDMSLVGNFHFGSTAYYNEPINNPDAEHSDIAYYIAGVPGGIRAKEDDFEAWNVHLANADSADSSIGFPGEIQSDYAQQLFLNDNNQYWDENLYHCFRLPDANSSKRNAIFQQFIRGDGVSYDQGIYDSRWAGASKESDLHPWNKSYVDWTTMTLFKNDSENLPSESLALNFEQFSEDQVTFYYMVVPGSSWIEGNDSNSTPYCKYSLGTKWDKNTVALRKTWAERDIFTKDFYLNAKGRTTDAVSTSTINGILEVKYEGTTPLDSDPEFNIDEANEHLHLLYRILTEKEFHRKSKGDDAYELMIMTRHNSGYAYIYDLEMLDIKHTDELVFSDDQSQQNKIYPNLTHGNNNFLKGYIAGDDPDTYIPPYYENQFMVTHDIGWNIVFSGTPFGTFHTQSIGGVEYSILRGMRLVYAKKIFSYSNNQLVVTGIEQMADETYWEEGTSINLGWDGEPGFGGTHNGYIDDVDAEIYSYDEVVHFNARNGCPYNEESSGIYLGYTTAYFNENTIEESNFMVEKPADIIRDLISSEIAPSAPSFDAIKFSKAMNSDPGMNLAFSLYEPENSKKILENICNQSRMFFRYRSRDGAPILDSIQNKYSSTDVSATIDVKNILKYSIEKTKFEDLCIGGCTVRYGYNYLTKELAKETPKKEFYPEALELYKSFYKIDDEENYQMEVEAPYIQDLQSAVRFRNYLFEFNKNQHLIVKFKLSVRDGAPLEVGDIIRFSGDSIEAYGIPLSQASAVVDQYVYPYFIITSVNRKAFDVSIESVQLHELNPLILEVTMLGDVNLDGKVDYLDRNMLTEYVAGNITLSEQQLLNADCSMDGVVDDYDIVALQLLETYDETAEQEAEDATNEALQGDLTAHLDVLCDILTTAGNLWVIDIGGGVGSTTMTLSGEGSTILWAQADDSAIIDYHFTVTRLFDDVVVLDSEGAESTYEFNLSALTDVGSYRVDLEVTGNYGVTDEASQVFMLFESAGDIFANLNLYKSINGLSVDIPWDDAIIGDHLVLSGDQSYAESADGSQFEVPEGVITNYHFKVLYASTGWYYEPAPGSGQWEDVPWYYGQTIIEQWTGTNPNLHWTSTLYPGQYLIYMWITVSGGYVAHQIEWNPHATLTINNP